MTENKSDKLAITLWGTRGTLPAPGPMFSRAGGNTNCVEVTCGDHTIIFDAGTGIRQLGSTIASEQSTRELHLMLTHAHYDHVEGVPFFAPFFNPQARVNVYCGELDGSNGTRETVEQLMRRPYFPVGPDVFSADVSYNDVAAHECFKLGEDISISTCPLNHPGGATGYRVDYHGKSFACITDTEHTPGSHDENILKLIDGVDLFIYDASFLDEELSEFEGYGHSTHEEAIRLAQMAGAGGVLATHHMPFRTDKELDEIEKLYAQMKGNSGIARESQKIIL